MAELGIRDQDAIDEQGTADPGAECEKANQTGNAFGRSIGEFGDSGRVGIIEKSRRHSKPPLELLATVHANPGIIDVGGRFDHTVPDDRRQGATHRSLVAEVIHDLGDNLQNGSRVRRDWRIDPVTLFSEIT